MHFPPPPRLLDAQGLETLFGGIICIFDRHRPRLGGLGWCDGGHFGFRAVDNHNHGNTIVIALLRLQSLLL